VSENSKLMEQLKDKSYREGFVFSQMSIPISFQIRALREQRGLTQKQLAEKANMLQPRIVELERPKGKEPNLRTLGRLAAAFDVALIVRFAPFSELVEWADHFSPDTFIVQSFDEDPGFHEREMASGKVRTPTAVRSILSSPPKEDNWLRGSVLSREAPQQQASQDPTEQRPFGSASMGRITSHADFLEARGKQLAAEMALPGGQHEARQNLPKRIQTIEQHAVK
jgi:transcriptional regulator with XRE-family HTH domain